jgi:hypothetical protein
MKYVTSVAEEYRSPDNWIANRLSPIDVDITLSYVFSGMNIRCSTSKGHPSYELSPLAKAKFPNLLISLKLCPALPRCFLLVLSTHAIRFR